MENRIISWLGPGFTRAWAAQPFPGTSSSTRYRRPQPKAGAAPAAQPSPGVRAGTATLLEGETVPAGEPEASPDFHADAGQVCRL